MKKRSQKATAEKLKVNKDELGAGSRFSRRTNSIQSSTLI